MLYYPNGVRLYRLTLTCTNSSGKMCLFRNIFQLHEAITKSSATFSRVLNNFPSKGSSINLVRRFCKDPPVLETDNPEVAPGWGKYKIFKDENARLILDIEEERMKSHGYVHDLDEDEFEGIVMERGVQGVFDIDELVELLKRENAQDVFVASLPREFNYVDFIVVVTGKSSRHMQAMAAFIRKTFKRKMHATDCIPKVEGENSKDWMAMDLGNIAVHIFSHQTRRIYDLESLWSVGSQFDEICNKPDDPLVQLLERHSVYLGDLQPAENLG